MKAEKVWAALGRYDKALADIGVAPVQLRDDLYDSKQLSDAELLCHCRWMAQKALADMRSEYEKLYTQAAQGGYGITAAVRGVEEAFKHLGKAMRWLAYIQGVLNVLGMYSCNDLRDHSRGDSTEPFKSSREEHG